MKNIFESLSDLREQYRRVHAHDEDAKALIVADLIDIVGALAATVEEMQLASGYSGLPDEVKPETPEPPKAEQDRGKFTPGPWEVDGNFVVVRGRDGRARLIAVRCFEFSAVETEANLRLMAASPDILEAIEAAMRIEALWAPGPNTDEAEGQALSAMRQAFVAVIAKAKGESVE